MQLLALGSRGDIQARVDAELLASICACFAQQSVICSSNFAPGLGTPANKPDIKELKPMHSSILFGLGGLQSERHAAVFFAIAFRLHHGRGKASVCWHARVTYGCWRHAGGSALCGGVQPHPGHLERQGPAEHTAPGVWGCLHERGRVGARRLAGLQQHHRRVLLQVSAARQS